MRKVAGLEEVSAAADAAPAGVTWQVVVGAVGMYVVYMFVGGEKNGTFLSFCAMPTTDLYLLLIAIGPD